LFGRSQRKERKLYVNFEEIKRMADSIREICGDDEDTLLDTLDGETDAMDVLGKLIEQRQWAKASQQAAKEMAAQYTERAKLYDARADATTQVIGHLLDAMGVKKADHPLGTVSRTKPRQKVVVEDPNEIPSQLMRITETPDLTAIKQQLEAGEFVPGATIKVGNPSVTVRIK
jgi:hypothetical protein